MQEAIRKAAAIAAESWRREMMLKMVTMMMMMMRNRERNDRGSRRMAEDGAADHAQKRQRNGAMEEKIMIPMKNFHQSTGSGSSLDLEDRR